MKNSYKIILSYVFIVICSFFILNFQASTINIVSKNALAQDYDVEGFVDENGNKQDPFDIGISNEEAYRFVVKYLPVAGCVIIVGLVLIIILQYSKLKRVEKPGLIKIENESAMLESDIASLIPHYDKDRFINARYNDFVEIKRAYLTNNRFKLKKKLSDQLYNSYCQQIDYHIANGETHTIRDTRYRGAIIKNIEHVNNMMILTLELKVCYYEFVEKNNALISGNRDKKVVVYYELKFITDLKEFLSECPHCGAKSQDTFKRICEYCNEEVEETDLKWYLNQENIVIKSYGDDI